MIVWRTYKPAMAGRVGRPWWRFLLCTDIPKESDEDCKLNLPRIVVTCHEEPGPIDGEEETVNASLQQRTPSEADQLAKAHQAVIDQMRSALKEARGGSKEDTEGTPGISQESGKPPVPANKAAAVAKIRAAIAQSRVESPSGQPLVAPAVALPDRTSPSDRPPPQPSEKEDRNDPARTHAPVPISVISGGSAEPAAVSAPTAVNPARAAAVAKLKAALLGAALAQQAQQGALTGSVSQSAVPAAAAAASATGEQRTMQQQLPSSAAAAPPQMSAPKLLSHTHHGGVAGGGVGVKRSLSTGDPVNQAAGGHQQRPLIWDFFEEGRSVGTCRTCGYEINIKRNRCGLVRHLSLVHKREYRDYTFRMDTNWTHGMMEKSLNMRVPKNI